jgi:hypothetical protein
VSHDERIEPCEREPERIYRIEVTCGCTTPPVGEAFTDGTGVALLRHGDCCCPDCWNCYTVVSARYATPEEIAANPLSGASVDIFELEVGP